MWDIEQMWYLLVDTANSEMCPVPLWNHVSLPPDTAAIKMFMDWEGKEQWIIILAKMLLWWFWWYGSMEWLWGLWNRRGGATDQTLLLPSIALIPCRVLTTTTTGYVYLPKSSSLLKLKLVGCVKLASSELHRSIGNI